MSYDFRCLVKPLQVTLALLMHVKIKKKSLKSTRNVIISDYSNHSIYIKLFNCPLQRYGQGFILLLRVPNKIWASIEAGLLKDQTMSKI